MLASVSAGVFLLAFGVIHHFEPRHSLILELIALSGFALSALIWLVVAVATPAPIVAKISAWMSDIAKTNEAAKFLETSAALPVLGDAKYVSERLASDRKMFDNVFEGWKGPARIRDERMSLQLSSSLPYVVVFSPTGKRTDMVGANPSKLAAALSAR